VGENTEDVLISLLGYEKNRVDKLRDDGVFG